MIRADKARSVATSWCNHRGVMSTHIVKSINLSLFISTYHKLYIPQSALTNQSQYYYNSNYLQNLGGFFICTCQWRSPEDSLSVQCILNTSNKNESINYMSYVYVKSENSRRNERTYSLPALVEDTVEFKLEKGRVGVPWARWGHGLFYRNLRIELMD